MCGIVAVLSAFTNGFNLAETKAFRDMLFVDTLRGWDSTGVFGVDNKGNVQIHKAALNGPNFIQTTEYEKFSDQAYVDGAILVGHNRAATRGTVTDANAHPFWVDDNIVLVQNGTWNGSHKHIKDTEVDTDALAHIIAETDDVEKALQKIDAAYALVWYNVKEKTLYAIRNMQRPLCIGYTKQGTVLLASEINTILFAAARQNLELREEPYEIEHGHLCKWEMKHNGFAFSCDKVDYMYKGSSFRQQQPWPYMGHHYDGEDAYDSYYKQRHGHSPASNETTGTDAVRTTMTTLIQQGTFPDLEMSLEDANNLIVELSSRPHGKPMVVEFFDYIKCNFLQNCTAFYLVGRPIVANDDIPLPLMYILQFGTTEEAVLEKVGKLFTASISSYQNNHVSRSGRNLVSAYLLNMQEIVNETQTTQ